MPATILTHSSLAGLRRKIKESAARRRYLWNMSTRIQRKFPIPVAAAIFCSLLALALPVGKAWATPTEAGDGEANEVNGEKDPFEVLPPAEPEATPPPEVEQIDATTLRIGLVTLDSSTREISFPGWVNMTQGLIEFPIVHRNGRVHEAIFATDALPLHIETALRLLRFETSQEIFGTFPDVDRDNPPPWNEWPDPVYPDPNPNSHVQAFARWQNAAGKMIEVDIREMNVRWSDDMLDPSDVPPQPIRLNDKASHWVFNGNRARLSTHVPELCGAILGIRPEFECSINTLPGEEIHHFTWVADPARIPPADMPVTLIIRPAEGNTGASSPAPAENTSDPGPSASESERSGDTGNETEKS